MGVTAAATGTALGPPRRILFVAPFPPRLDGTHGGSRVIAQSIVETAARHHVAVLCFQPGADEPADRGVREAAAFVEEVRLDFGSTARARWRRRARTLRALGAGEPLWAAQWYDRAFEARLAETVRRWQPDVVRFEFHLMAQYTSAAVFPGAARILVSHESAGRAAPSSRRRLGSRLVDAFDARAWEMYERRILGGVDAVVAFTPQDAAALVPRAGRTPVLTIPFATSLAETRPGRDDGSTVLFVGSFRHRPNVEAAIRLCARIFPGVRAAVPGARLTIAGESPPPELRRHASETVTIAGRVPDLQSVLEPAAVLVMPLSSGGGMRVKAVEALAAGKALVATPTALEGLDVAGGREVLVAETDAEFVAATAGLLRHGPRRQALGAGARAWARSHLSWPPVLDRYDALYDSLCRHAGVPR